VPAIPPQTIALFPIFFPKTASPTAAPKTIWVKESILSVYTCYTLKCCIALLAAVCSADFLLKSSAVEISFQSTTTATLKQSLLSTLNLARVTKFISFPFF
jgi:hypothetical protein